MPEPIVAGGRLDADAKRKLELARRGYAAFRRGGAAAVLEFLDPEIEWVTWDQFARSSRVMHGHDGFLAVFSAYAENLDELQIDPLEFILAGEQIVVPFLLRGRERGSGEEFEVELVHVWTAPGELVTRVEVYASKQAALDAVGITFD